MKKFTFKGLMAPVFTPFNIDELLNVKSNHIDKYAEMLKSKGINGVLVNGTSGEGMLMSVGERKTTTELWSTACKKHGITLMVQIGGAPLPDVIELGRHAERIEADAVLCLPELYFRPKTEEELVEYFVNIAEHCKNIPLLYYHIPMFSGVNLNMPRFLDLAEKSVPNLVGIKYTSGDLEQGTACLKENRSIFLGADTILVGALALGFDSAIMTTLNIYPELSIKIVELMKQEKVKEALKVQQDLNKKIKTILVKGGWVPAMKSAFNDVTGFEFGLPRKPL